MVSSANGSDDVWLDAEAGPVVRPYAMTRGRTRSSGDFDLITLILATRTATALPAGLEPEHVAIVNLCQRPLSVAEVSAHLDLPVGIVRVMLGDLLDRQVIMVRGRETTGQVPSQRVLEAVINGLRAL
jgi:hypothetical protein